MVISLHALLVKIAYAVHMQGTCGTIDQSIMTSIPSYVGTGSIQAAMHGFGLNDLNGYIKMS